ncbi:MAG TPA: DUF2924 domain-containing protein [Rhizomicrobium sp.]|jgi:hypothetical protein|nr:DUF2924 domain-containing protein [Rhizomicrobium sp.]
MSVHNDATIETEDATIETEIARLRDLNLEGLKLRWRTEFGRMAPALSKSLLLRLLAYRLQAQVFGDLSQATRRMLETLTSEPSGKDKQAPVPLPDRNQLMPGTVLIREHNGHQHHVMVAEGGFAWDGKTYPSLSKVACAITGTKWNGPRFFGLREKALAP